MARTCLAIVLGLFCAACVSAPDLKRAPRIEMRFGEKPKTEPKPSPKPKPPEPVLEKEVADPPAQSSQNQLVFHLKVDHQELSLLRVERNELTESRVTPRRYGRFALEAYRQDELVERLRFDFPLLGDTRSALDEVEPGLVTSTQVEFPELPGVTRLVVVDRKSRKVLELPLPGCNAASAGGSASVGGSASAGGGSASGAGGSGEPASGASISTGSGPAGASSPSEKGHFAGPSSAGGAVSTQKPAK